ncbi:hypothetical protein ACO0K9_20640 [Undibacterium sp. Ji50W]|uniref:hypothetical protein n=1 Tax=Undibacterium sp. Ji50W TaxID=3413041 RepID=UPI003BF1F7E7
MLHRFKVLKFIILVVGGIAALSWVVMMLWNWLMPALFVGARSIDFLQAVALLVLSKILFGGFRGHHGGWHRHGGHHWQHQRWEKLTPEEREKFQHGLFGRRKHRDEVNVKNHEQA